MLNKIVCAIAIMLSSISMISCNTTSREKLIIGTWIPVSPKAEDMPEMRIRFLANKIGVAERKGEQPSSKDSVTYEIKNEGKLLVTTERSGRVEEVEIIELTKKNLIVYSKENGDTMKLVRE